MEEKNEGYAWEGEVLAWLSEVLVSNEDGDRGSARNEVGNGIDGRSECCTESTSWELSPVWLGLSRDKLWGQDCHELALHQCRFQVRRRNCQP